MRLEMKHRICIGALALALFGATDGRCEDVLIYSYAGIAQQTWAVMPVVADLKDSAPATLFEALRRQKMPTYGTTSYDAGQNRVDVDGTKCAYASVISAEISHTFMAHGHKIPQVMCGQRAVPAANGSLTHYRQIVPLWQALGNVTCEPNALVAVGTEFVGISEFRQQLKSKDKSLAKAIEAGFSDPNPYVKSGLMQGYIANRFPGAEKRVAQELSASNADNVNAAMGALAGTRDPAIVRQMNDVMKHSGTMQAVYATSLASAAAPEIRAESLRIMLKSSDDAVFGKACETIDADRNDKTLETYGAELLDAATPQHAKTLAERMLDRDMAETLSQWLLNAPTSDAALSAAGVALSQARDASAKHTVATRQTLKHAALSMLITSDRSVTAFDALDELEMDETARNSVIPWLHGLASGYAAIRVACAAHLSQTVVSDEATRQTLSKSISSKQYHADIYAPEITIGLALGGVKEGLKAADIHEKRAAYLALDAGAPELTKPAPGVETEGARVMSVALHHLENASDLVGSKVRSDKAPMRRDAAAATRWLDASADSLRAILLKDGDETVVETLLRQFSFRPSEEISTAMVKDITARVERSKPLKMAALTVLPDMMNEKTSHVITTFVSNEMFDEDVNVRITAIRALSRIAIVSKDPVVADNAISSLALTAQDKSSAIVHHTLTALARTHQPSAVDIIRRAKDTHPESYKRALEIYPFEN